MDDHQHPSPTLDLAGSRGVPGRGVPSLCSPHGPWHLLPGLPVIGCAGIDAVVACPVPPSGSELRADLVL